MVKSMPYTVEVNIRRHRTGWQIEQFFLGDTVTFEAVQLTVSVESLYQRVDNEEMLEWLAEKAQQQATDADKSEEN